MIWFKRNIPLENKLQKLEGALGGQWIGGDRGDTDGTGRAGRGHRGHMAQRAHRADWDDRANSH